MHLRTSKVLICQRHRVKAPLPPRYLCNLLLYWDLLVSLHSDSTHDEYSTEMLMTGHHSEIEPIVIDPTVGVAVDLFRDIVEMENFLRFYRSQQTAGLADSPQHIEAALNIEKKLVSWKPELDACKLRDCIEVFETCALQDILFTAEAYRIAALLLLYRSVPALHRYRDNPGQLSLEATLRRMASSILRLLSAILITSPVCTTHQWVLFVTAPDVTASQEREFVRDRMSGLLDKIGIVGIKEVMDYVEDFWRQLDTKDVRSSAWMDGMHSKNWYPLLG